MSPGFLHVLVASVLVLPLATSPSLAAETYPPPFPSGASALFAGHSFFAGVATDFDTIALANGYDDHSADIVLSGSQSGSPRRLWENSEKRAEIIGHLDARDIDLFGLTVFSEDDSRFEDYERWFNEALKHNPDTQFYIGHPQTPEGAVTPSALYEEMTEELGERTFEVVMQLRAAYPNNAVHFIHYGKVATEMKHRYDANELPDIRALLPDEELMIGRDEAMFTDISPGHGGTMLKELGALSWMNLLYGADIDSLDYTEYQSDVSGIIADVGAFNEQFLATVVGDYNGNGGLEGADFLAWQRDSNVGSLSVWQTNYGPGSSAVIAAIPEPSGLVLATLSAAFAGVRRRR